MHFYLFTKAKIIAMHNSPSVLFFRNFLANRERISINTTCKTKKKQYLNARHNPRILIHGSILYISLQQRFKMIFQMLFRGRISLDILAYSQNKALLASQHKCNKKDVSRRETSRHRHFFYWQRQDIRE